MKTVADVLGVSRSNLLERLKGKSKPRGPYLKADDCAATTTVAGSAATMMAGGRVKAAARGL